MSTKTFFFVNFILLLTCCSSTSKSSSADEQIDPQQALHDIWVLESIDGRQVETVPKRPELEINVTENRVMGTDGCNNFFGDIKAVDSSRLVLGPLAGTKKACPDMKIADQFNRNLSKVTSYKRQDLKLLLYDREGNELLSFKKVD